MITFFFTGSAFTEEQKILTAFHTTTPIKLDGILNEAAWKDAAPATGFTQRELTEGAPPTENTEVSVIYDDDNLYIGIKCFDSEPDKIVHTELRYDGQLFSDDNFTVVLDTFNDKRTGYIFRINPNGARNDALIENVEHHNDEWNGIWDAAARITDIGWSAEMVIPFMAIRFPKTEIQEWGINFSRTIRRKNEEILWTAWGRNDGIQQLSKAGKLTGLRDIKRGKKTEFTPYILGGVEKEINRNIDNTIKYGLDIKYPLTSDLTLDFTTKTDFAQIESDQEQINLTRFSLNYPEKRDFFLEGVETFDFSVGRSNMLYYSRRIGITPDPDREQVSILGGAKLSGKAGSFNIGVMNVQTEQTTVYTIEDDSTETKKVYPGTNYTIVRVKKDIFKQSYIGFIGTVVNKERKPEIPFTGTDRIDRFLNKKANHMAGIDFEYNTSSFLNDKNFTVSGYFAASKTPDLSGDNTAGRIAVDFPNDLIDASFGYHVIGNNFNPEIGFIRRPGIKETAASFRYMPRVGIPYVKQLILSPYHFHYFTDMNNRLVTRFLSISPFGLEFESGDRLEFQVVNNYEYIDEEFTIFGDTVIPLNSYQWWNYEISYESMNTRPLSIDFETQWGDYYNGEQIQFDTNLTYKLNQYFAFTPGVSYNDITIGNESFQTKEANFRLGMNLSTRFTTSTFIQWNNESNEANMNFRIHYIPKIGSDVYVVYNHLWDERDNFRTLRNTAILKIDYLFRF